MQIEKTVVHRFQRKREGKVAVAWDRSRAGCRRTGIPSSLAYEFAFDLSKARHGTNRHVIFQSSIADVSLVAPGPVSAQSYKRLYVPNFVIKSS